MEALLAFVARPLGLALAASCALTLTAFGPGPALGDVTPFEVRYAQNLYAEGEYERAASTASQVRSADSLTLAAQAWNAHALTLMDAEAALPSARLAHEAAEQALGLDPNHVQARLQLAIALWLEGRTLAPMASYRQRVPQRGRDLIESAALDAPSEAWAFALLGAWHLEVARKGGGLGSAMLGADVKDGVRYLRAALAMAPHDPAVATQCAVALLAYDAERYRDDADAALELAKAATPQDAFQAAMQARAHELDRHLDAGDDVELAQAVSAIIDG